MRGFGIDQYMPPASNRRRGGIGGTVANVGRALGGGFTRALQSLNPQGGGMRTMEYRPPQNEFLGRIQGYRGNASPAFRTAAQGSPQLGQYRQAFQDARPNLVMPPPGMGPQPMGRQQPMSMVQRMQSPQGIRGGGAMTQDPRMLETMSRLRRLRPF